jgi:hypothetical protein
LRLLEIVEATPDDEEYDDEDEDDDEYLPELARFAGDLEAEWSLYRRVGRRSVHPLQKLRRWLVSLLG